MAVTQVRRKTVVTSNAPVRTSTSGSGYAEKKVIFRTYQIIWYLLGIFETLLILRFIFRLSGASTVSPFVSLVYGISSALIAPFRGIYRTTQVESVAFEWITIVAMLMYLLFAYALVYLFQLVKPVDETEVEDTVDNQ